MDRPVAGPTNVALDRVVRTVGEELDAPVVCLSLVDRDRRLMTSAIGLPPSIALILSWSFARHVLTSRGPFLVDDARLDPRVARCGAVQEGAVAAYLGVRLTATDGRAVGTLSVMDPTPRSWAPYQLGFVRQVCDRVVREMESGMALTTM